MDATPEIALTSSTRSQNFRCSILAVAWSIGNREPLFLWLALFFILVLVLITNKRVEFYLDRIVVYRWALFRIGKSVRGYGELKGVLYRQGAYTAPWSMDLHWLSGKRKKGVERPGDYIRSRFEEILYMHQIPTKTR